MTKDEILKLATPAYLFNVDGLLSRVKRIRAALGKRYKLCYAVKANPFLAESLVREADAFECCSPGEYDICMRMGIPPEKIVLSGVYKSEADVRRTMLRCGEKAVYTAESASQAELLCRLAKESGTRPPVLLRLSSGNQFGMDRAAVLNILKNSAHLPICVEGIQYYSGTQKRMGNIFGELDMLVSFFAEAAEIAPQIRRLEYGPGLKVGYFEGDREDEDECLCAFAEKLKGISERYETVLELGRFIAADCGQYCTRIVDLKRTDGKGYCIVDGGIHHLKYYGQTMAMKTPHIVHFGAGEGEPERWTICGSLCTTADVLARDVPLYGAKVGDMLVFGKAGAYSVTEGMGLFLSRDLPRIYKEEDGACVLLRDFIQTSKINCKGDNDHGKIAFDPA